MTAPRLAWALFGLWVALAVAGTVFAAREGSSEVLYAPALLVFGLVAAFVASRRPDNPIGWILLAIVVVSGFTIALESYVASVEDPPPTALWLDDWIANIWIALVAIWVPLLFPDGRLPSRRWRPVAWLGTAAFAIGTAASALGDRTLDTAAPEDITNPYALSGAAGDFAAEIATLADLAFAPVILASLAGIVIRFRRSRGVERQQLKWFAFVGGLMIAALSLAAISLIYSERLGDNIGIVGWGSFLLLVTFGLPLAIGAAILRHRLYDIDVVINRALVYGALTLTLAATYLGLVLLLGLTVGESDLAVAGSTLAVAALFGPARARIQAAVDRRFYRRRYDATHTLENFSARLRDELDLDALRSEIRTVVGETVQPAHVSLWLRSRNDFRTQGP